MFPTPLGQWTLVRRTQPLSRGVDVTQRCTLSLPLLWPLLFSQLHRFGVVVKAGTACVRGLHGVNLLQSLIVS